MVQGNDKVALVTGAARGIGLATVKRFLADGWRVALLDIDTDTLRATMKALDAPERTLALELDISDAAAVLAAIATIKTRFGRLDALVNNATGNYGEWDHESLFFYHGSVPYAIVVFTRGDFSPGKMNWPLGAMIGGLFREYIEGSGSRGPEVSEQVLRAIPASR